MGTLRLLLEEATAHARSVYQRGQDGEAVVWRLRRSELRGLLKAVLRVTGVIAGGKLSLDLLLSVLRRFSRSQVQQRLRTVLPRTLKVAVTLAVCAALSSLLRRRLFATESDENTKTEARSANAKIRRAAGVGVATFLASSVFYLYNPLFKSSIPLWIFVRGVADLLRSVNDSQSDSTAAWCALFGVTQAPLMFAFLHRPAALHGTLHDFVLRAGNMDRCKLNSLKVQSDFARDNKLHVSQHAPCSPLFHEDPSCWRYNTTEWTRGFARGARVYLPLQLIRLIVRLVSRSGSVADAVTSTLRGTVRSSAFVATYVVVMKSSQCALRHATGRDTWWTASLGGLLTAFSLALDQPTRQRELTLFCLPRALETLQVLFPRLACVFQYRPWRQRTNLDGLTACQASIAPLCDTPLSARTPLCDHSSPNRMN
ncbi:MAG: hypothetical protein MHM6MM_005665 [Cercozoa sp. M6MM]